ncbi:hypothetical protein BH09BAC5_BH09BAC5_21100 [soil metagenome]
MDRNQFLKTLGFGSAAILMINEMQSCKKSQSVDFTIDISTSPYTALQNIGGSVVKDNIIIAKTPAGSYIAVSVTCTHNGCSVNYTGSSNHFSCPCHGALFDANGSVLNGPATTPLTQYNCAIAGNSLHVFS